MIDQTRDITLHGDGIPVTKQVQAASGSRSIIGLVYGPCALFFQRLSHLADGLYLYDSFRFRMLLQLTVKCYWVMKSEHSQR